MQRVSMQSLSDCNLLGQLLGCVVAAQLRTVAVRPQRSTGHPLAAVFAKKKKPMRWYVNCYCVGCVSVVFPAQSLGAISVPDVVAGRLWCAGGGAGPERVAGEKQGGGIGLGP